MTNTAPIAQGVLAGLRRRLLVMLLLPLMALALVNAWFDYRAAGSVAAQQDLRLQLLAPLLADSIVAAGAKPLDAPVLLLAPAIQDFLSDGSSTAFGVATLDGRMMLGEAWLSTPTPSTNEPEFHSEVSQGTTYRIVAQRAQTAGGELVVMLADGADARQNWVRALLLKVMLPNLLLLVVGVVAVHLAVQRALKPLIALKEAVERRSPRDLSALDTSSSPEEVRPLVESLNRLFGLMHAQVQSQRRFIADAAHQLRTPLAGLQAQVEAWAQAVDSAQSAVHLDANQIYRLRSATRRTTQLANQLLALSRADAEASAMQPMQQVDLAALCAEVLAQHLDAASAKGLDLGLDLPAHAQAAHTNASYTTESHTTASYGNLLSANSSNVQATQPALITTGHDWLLRELLSNLTDNAIQYTPPGGSVTIRCAWADPLHNEIVLEVLDDGPGIAPEERQQVLERFYRVKGTAVEGNGLGLAIADEIARLHASRLQLDDARISPAGQRHTGLRVALVLRPSAAAHSPVVYPE